MKNKVLSLIAGRMIALTAFSGTASAESEFNLNENGANCHGQIVAWFSSNGVVNPGQAAKLLSEYFDTDITAGEVNQFVKALCAED